MNDTAGKIREKALGLGYEKCGIIKVSDVGGYTEKLEERMASIPMGEALYARFRPYANPQKQFPWAKSIIVLVTSYTGYNVPQGIDEIFAKHYLFDTRLDENCKEFKMRADFAAFLEAQGIKAVTEPKFGLTAMRWAAYKAGLGVIRQNNFFYTENGSWNHMEAWLTDQEMEWIEHTDMKPCPDNCRKCIKACPTGSLSQPYTMALNTCISFKTTTDPTPPILAEVSKYGKCIYGCDICQEVCPFNEGKMNGGSDFPGIKELSDFMAPEKIIMMDYKDIDRLFAKKYWHIKRGYLWKWKTNALAHMYNNFIESYKDPVKSAAGDTDTRVRDFAGQIITTKCL